LIFHPKEGNVHRFRATEKIPQKIYAYLRKKSEINGEVRRSKTMITFTLHQILQALQNESLWSIYLSDKVDV